MADRITREVTPFVLVLDGSAGTTRTRLLHAIDGGEILDEDGRAVLKTRSADGRPKRILLDPDADLYGLVSGTEADLLRRPFEVHVSEAFGPGGVPHELRGVTLVVPEHLAPTLPEGTVFAIDAPAGTQRVAANAAEAHVRLPAGDVVLEVWPDPPPPAMAVLPLGRPEATEQLSQLLHGMGSGRIPVRELRLRIDPRAYQLRERRPPFISEVIEGVASAVGCGTTSLVRELALRQRLLERGLRRHLMPDPFFVTWTFRGHKTRGLVPATDQFPVPRRPSRQEILRGTPESERERLIAYLALLEDPRPRLAALEARDLFAVSVHFLPNPDLPIVPQHGGIMRWVGGRLAPLA